MHLHWGTDYFTWQILCFTIYLTLLWGKWNVLVTEIPFTLWLILVFPACPRTEECPGVCPGAQGGLRNQQDQPSDCEEADHHELVLHARLSRQQRLCPGFPLPGRALSPRSRSVQWRHRLFWQRHLRGWTVCTCYHHHHHNYHHNHHYNYHHKSRY